MIEYKQITAVSIPACSTKLRFNLDHSRQLKTLVNKGFESILKEDHSVWGGLFLSVFSHILVTNWSQELVANYD